MKVLITTSTFAEIEKEPLEVLQESHIDYTVNPFKRKLSEEELLELLRPDEYVGLIAGTEPISKRVFDAYPSLRVISRVGVGLDNIDLEATKERDVRVFRTPDVLTDAVAELTLGFMLSGLRKISLQDRNLRSGIWQKQMGSLLKGKTVGIFGFGRVGKRLAELLKPFHAEIIFSDSQEVASGDAKQVSFETLLRESDILSLHAGSTDLIFDRPTFQKMKEGVLFINTARGSLVDEAALAEALQSKKIQGACLDVFSQEPYEGPLTQFENVILTPHIGSYAEEARREMERESARNLVQGLKEVGLL